MKRAFALVFAISIILTWGCDDDPVSPTDTLAIARVSGNAQEGRAGATLSAPLVVLVTDASGVPVSNQRVDFTVTLGDARLSVESAVSDGRGQASTRLTLGDELEEVHVQGRIFGHDTAVVFTATVIDPADGGADLPTTGLVAHYPFDGNAADATQNSNDGEVYGPVPVEDRFHLPNSAYSFDGVDDYIILDSLLNGHPTASITIACWIYINGEITAGRIVDNQDWTDGNPKGFNLYYNDDNGINFYPDIHNSYYLSGSALERNEWHFVAASWDGSTVKIHINNSLTTTGANSGPLEISNTRLVIGNAPTRDRSFDGAIDDIRIYNRALTVDEIAELYAEGGWESSF